MGVCWRVNLCLEVSVIVAHRSHVDVYPLLMRLVIQYLTRLLNALHERPTIHDADCTDPDLWSARMKFIPLPSDFLDSFFRLWVTAVLAPASHENIPRPRSHFRRKRRIATNCFDRRPAVRLCRLGSLRRPRILRLAVRPLQVMSGRALISQP